MMQYEVLDEKQLPQLDPFDFNKANVCYVHPSSLSALHISAFGYRLLKTKLSQHIVIIIPNESMNENTIVIPIELKATLKLQEKEKVIIQRIPIKINTDLYGGLPTLKVADRIEFILVQNQNTDLLESDIVKKIIKEPFYFALGQQFSIPLSKIPDKIIKEFSLAMRKKWRRVIDKSRDQDARLFVEGVRYTENKVPYYEMWEVKGKPTYYIYDPNNTNINVDKTRSINRPNQTVTKLSDTLTKLYELPPYSQLKQEFDKLALTNTCVILLEKKKNFGIREYLKYISQENNAYFYSLDCEKEYSTNGISEFIDGSYSKSPALIYLDNIEWIYSLFSGQLEPKRNSFKYVQLLIEKFKDNLLKKGNSYPLLLILSYSQNPYEVENLDAHQLKFNAKKQDIEVMNRILLDQYGKEYSGEEIHELIQLSKTIPWELLAGILSKKKSVKQITKALENAIKTEKVAQIPKVNWSDIGGLEVAKDEIIQTILFPKMYPEIFDELIKPRSGLLFYGPPGTGKTLLAKCIANQCKMNFISVKGPEMLNMYIGESEKNVRETFERAFESKPCIIFFDELDALIPKRGKSNDSGQVMDRIVAELLSQMDNAWRVGDIFVIGATNRPDLLDPSIMRPGRFDKQIYLGICYEKEERVNILKAQTKKLKLGNSVNFQQIVEELPVNFTGADFYGLTSKALTISIQKLVERIEASFDPATSWDDHLKGFEEGGVVIEQQDMLQALKQVKPSVSLEELKKFEQLKSKYS